MMALRTLIAHQRNRESRFRWFLDSLDATRTVTLASVLTPADRRAKLHAAWLDLPRFMERLTWASRFVSALPPHPRTPGWSGCPLIFFQSAPPDEDETEHQRRLVMPHSFYAERRVGLPAQISYLHIETNWVSHLDTNAKGRVVPPLHPFSNRGRELVLPESDDGAVPNGQVIGYRLPEYPKLLGVSNAVATDYLARIVIHDIGHGVLPSVCEPEELHNVTMLWAMGIESRRAIEPQDDDGWEELVRAECSNPHFFLEAETRLKPFSETTDPVRRHIVTAFADMYVARAQERRQRLWDIAPAMPLASAKARALEVVRMMRLDGFMRYETRDMSYKRKTA